MHIRTCTNCRELSDLSASMFQAPVHMCICTNWYIQTLSVHKGYVRQNIGDYTLHTKQVHDTLVNRQPNASDSKLCTCVYVCTATCIFTLRSNRPHDIRECTHPHTMHNTFSLREWVVQLTAPAVLSVQEAPTYLACSAC